MPNISGNFKRNKSVENKDAIEHIKAESIKNIEKILEARGESNWTMTEVVSTESNENSYEPSLAVDSSGTVHVAWHDLTSYHGSGDFFDIFYKNKTGNGWSDTEVVSMESSDPACFPSLAVDSNGTVHVAWQDETPLFGSGEDSDIFYKQKPSDGDWSAPELVSEGCTGGSYSPCLCVESNGTVHIAWQDYTHWVGGNNIDIFYRMRTPDGDWIATDIVTPVSIVNHYSPSIDIDSDRTVHVAYFGDNKIYYNSKPYGYSWTGIEPISTESMELCLNPSLAVDSNKTVHVAWQDYSYGNTDISDISYKMKPFAGVWETTERVSTEDGDSSQSPSLAVDDLETVHIGWTYCNDTEDILYKQKPKNEGWSSSEIVSTESTEASIYPSLAVDSDGFAHIAWFDSTNYNSSDHDYDIFYKKRKAILLSISTQQNDNEPQHHTEKFKNNSILFLRRNNTFDVELKLTEKYDPLSHEIWFKAEHDFEDMPTEINIPFFLGSIPSDQWGTRQLNMTINPDSTINITMQINIPKDVAIGEYMFSGLVNKTATDEILDSKAFGTPVVILFNPWGLQDTVYMANASGRNEYVLNEAGLMWVGSNVSMHSIGWRYAQFNNESVDVTLELLNGLSAQERSDPIVVSRHLSSNGNSMDNDGVIWGKWEPPYTGAHKLPWEWIGSDEILEIYQASCDSVKYGQCWNFGGVLTTMLRCLGIPSRPITNFNSVHDTNSDKIIDIFFLYNGMLDDSRSEMIWNFHVWCDAWMQRDDRPGYDGWQAIDATPQEPSDGLYQCGPAPVDAVRDDLGGDYDVDFVFAEVDADIRYWWNNGSTDVLQKTDTTQTGQNISTKKVGAATLNNITHLYKSGAKQRADFKRTTTLPESGIIIDFHPKHTVAMGSDIIWNISIDNTNGDVMRLCHVVMVGSAISYNGGVLSQLDQSDSVIPVPVGEVKTVEISIPETTYIDWTNYTQTFEVSAFVSVIGTSDVFVDLQRTYLFTPQINLTLIPNTPIDVYESVECQATWTNPFSMDLHNAALIYSVGENLLVDGDSQIDFGTIPSDEIINVSRNITCLELGTHLIIVQLTSDELSNIKGYTFVTVEVPNRPPDTPARPSGPTFGYNNRSYNYSTSTTDPDGDTIYYNFSWGDGNCSGWIGPYNSSEIINANHKWTHNGTYKVRVKAKDKHGANSNWSDNLSIFIYEGFILNLNDFPMYEAESDPGHHEMCGPAVAQMTLNYIWWNSTQDSVEPPMMFDDQLWLYDRGIENNSNASLPYLDAQGLWHLVQYNKPMPYGEYGYNFGRYSSTNLSNVTKRICLWINYTIGSISGGHKSGYPLHVPVLVPVYGGYSNWMAIRGFHADRPAFPMPDELTVYGFWVNDPYPSVLGGIGENSYKTYICWLDDYYRVVDVEDDWYNGSYLMILEPPAGYDASLEQTGKITSSESLSRFSERQRSLVASVQTKVVGNVVVDGVVKKLVDQWVVDAAVDGLVEQLLPFDSEFACVFESTVAGTPLFVNSVNGNDYYLVPFDLQRKTHVGLLETQSTTLEKEPIVFDQVVGKLLDDPSIVGIPSLLNKNAMIVVVIDADDGSFKEASWVKNPVKYLPISKSEAQKIVLKSMKQHRITIEDIEKSPIELIYRDSTPYYPEWEIILNNQVIYVNQMGDIVK